jgi:antitoxin MazE6
MKTAISIPDEVFQDAETLARQMSISRSKLYSQALREYISRHAPDSVTEVLDRLCREIDGAADPFVAAASRRILERTEW